MESYQRHYLDINGQHSAVYEDVEAGLRAMRDSGLRLACVTNKPLAFALPLLKIKGLDGYFEVLYGGDSFARRSPIPCRCWKPAAISDWNRRRSWPSAIRPTTPRQRVPQAARCSPCHMDITTEYLYTKRIPMV